MTERDKSLKRLSTCKNIFAIGWTPSKNGDPPDLVQLGDVSDGNSADLMYSLALGIGTLFDEITDQTGITFYDLRTYLEYALDKRPERGEESS